MVLLPLREDVSQMFADLLQRAGPSYISHHAFQQETVFAALISQDHQRSQLMMTDQPEVRF